MEKEPKPQGERELEIERKFLIESLPDNLEQYPSQNIRQGYLEISDAGVELRVRQIKDRFVKTTKKGSGKTREETETEISEDEFNELWLKTEGKRVEKIRYLIPYNESTIELDVYQGQLEGLITAEVEFMTNEASEQFSPPEWLGEEVTGDQSYTNYSLAVNGKP